MRAVTLAICFLAACLGATMFGTDEPSSTADSASWSGKAAAAYLDGRMVWWMGWEGVARDHKTFCVSCHTVVPYAMARPAPPRPSGDARRASPLINGTPASGQRHEARSDVEGS